MANEMFKAISEAAVKETEKRTGLFEDPSQFRAIILTEEEHGVVFKEEKGVKHDGAKPDLSLIPREPLWELARVLMAGERKYGRYNWKGGIDIHRLTSAAMRHITQFNEGEDLDDETKTSHLMNACANLFFAHWMLLNKSEHDTRENK